MNKLIAIIFFSWIAGIVHGQELSGDTWEIAQQQKTANIVATYTYAPKFSEIIDGQNKGLCFDIMEDFIAYVEVNYGIKINVKYISLSDPKDFDLFLDTVQKSQGGVFGLGDITITKEREASFNFSNSYFSNVGILATNNSVPTLSSFDAIGKEFAGMTAIIQKGTTHEGRMEKIKTNYYPTLRIETTKSYISSNKKVISNNNYFTYIDFSTYLDVISNRIPLKRHEVGDQKGEEFGFIMPKSNDWSPLFNEFLSANGGYTKSVEYRKLLAKNLGSHVVKLMNALNK